MNTAHKIDSETMYMTIKAAFENGQGDVFFTKNGKYIAKSRKDNLSYYFENNYRFLTYDEIIKISKQQEEQKIDEPKISIIENMKNMNRMVKSVSTCESYYDEFPDAYNQNL